VLNIELISPYGQARFETLAREVTDQRAISPSP
jgi:hypothetical protein